MLRVVGDNREWTKSYQVRLALASNPKAPLVVALGFVGGLVEKGSVKREADGVSVRFVATDTAKSITVAYRGILPDLFREGKGVVTQGKVGADGLFRAEEVLAKHDENYMPPAAQDALNQATAKNAAQTVVPPWKGK